MITKEMTKSEIEREISKWGDYVQIDNMTRFLKVTLHIPIDIKKFVHQKLAEVYERRRMFLEAAKNYEKIIELCTSPSEKRKICFKTVETYINSGNFEKAETLAKRMIEEGGKMERMEVTNYLKEAYTKEIDRATKEKRRRNVIRIYERMLDMGIYSE